MKEITLIPKEQPAIPLEADVISPDVFAGKDTKGIKELEVYHGNARGKLGDFFEISGSKVEDAEKLRIIVKGDVKRTKRIGQGMTAGEIVVKGSADMYVGARMKGGRIIVEGDVDAFAGLQMRGGEFIVKGNAGNYLGAPYRGDWRGMRGGRIVVEGDVGSEVGEFMRGGRIHVKGKAGPFLGLHMAKGLIVVDGGVESRLGAQMTGGSIVAVEAGELLPGFKLVEKVKDVEIDEEVFKGKYAKYSGDHAEYRAKGVLYVKQ